MSKLRLVTQSPYIRRRHRQLTVQGAIAMAFLLLWAGLAMVGIVMTVQGWLQ